MGCDGVMIKNKNDLAIKLWEGKKSAWGIGCGWLSAPIFLRKQVAVCQQKGRQIAKYDASGAGTNLLAAECISRGRARARERASERDNERGGGGGGG